MSELAEWECPTCGEVLPRSTATPRKSSLKGGPLHQRPALTDWVTDRIGEWWDSPESAARMGSVGAHVAAAFLALPIQDRARMAGVELAVTEQEIIAAYERGFAAGLQRGFEEYAS